MVKNIEKDFMINKNIKKILTTFCLGLCITTVFVPCVQAAEVSNKSKLKTFGSNAATFTFTAGSASLGGAFGIVALISAYLFYAISTEVDNGRPTGNPGNIGGLALVLGGLGLTAIGSGVLSLLSFGTAGMVFLGKESKNLRSSERNITD